MSFTQVFRLETLFSDLLSVLIALNIMSALC